MFFYGSPDETLALPPADGATATPLGGWQETDGVSNPIPCGTKVWLGLSDRGARSGGRVSRGGGSGARRHRVPLDKGAQNVVVPWIALSEARLCRAELISREVAARASAGRARQLHL